MMLTTGNVPKLTEEQKKLSKLAFRPNSRAEARKKPGPCITIVEGGKQIENPDNYVSQEEASQMLRKKG